MLETGTLVHYPGIAMSRFGTTELGENKYRVIWAPSRLVILTGERGPMTVPLYGLRSIEPIGDYWILESWKSPQELCGTRTEKEWNSDQKLLITGPFPARGDYVRRETFATTPTVGSVEKLISWLEEGGKRRDIENVLAIQKNLEADIASRRSKKDAILRDCLRPGDAASAYIGAGTRQRANKDTPILRSTRGMPKPGSTSMGRKRVTYEIPQEAWEG